MSDKRPDASITLPDVNTEAPASRAPANTSPTTQQTQTAPYAVRALQFTFELGTGSFGTGKANQLTVGGIGKNLRAVAHIEVANAPTTGMATFHIYGMTLDQMNTVSKAGLVYKNSDNKIACQAGDAMSGLVTVYNGLIVEAWPDMRQPDSPLFVLASPGGTIQLKPVPATSFFGPTPASTALGKMAQAGGLTFENNGVNTVLQSPYFHGSAWNQIMSCVRAADCFAYLDGVKKTLAVWPKNGSRGGSPTIISPETGMIDYPKFQALQTKVRVLFNPNLFAGNGPGHQIQIKSQLTAANGLFTINSLAHDLSSEFPDGPWETSILATPAS